MLTAIRVWLTTLFKSSEDKISARIAALKAKLEALEAKLEERLKKAAGQ